MKKTIFAVITLLVIVSAMSFAQTATTSANVTANVTSVVTITNTVGLAFGNVTRGAVTTVASNTASAAAFTIFGAAGASTTIAITYPATLTNSPNSMAFSSTVYPRTNTVAGYGSTGATVATDYSNFSATTSSTGYLYLFVGGAITAASDQVSGSYSGTITVTVTQS
jgi:hypothetical protein